MEPARAAAQAGRPEIVIVVVIVLIVVLRLVVALSVGSAVIVVVVIIVWRFGPIRKQPQQRLFAFVCPTLVLLVVAGAAAGT